MYYKCLRTVFFLKFTVLESFFFFFTQLVLWSAPEIDADALNIISSFLKKKRSFEQRPSSCFCLFPWTPSTRDRSSHSLSDTEDAWGGGTKISYNWLEFAEHSSRSVWQCHHRSLVPCQEQCLSITTGSIDHTAKIENIAGG